MPGSSYVVVTDRGGHLHNALEMIRQMGTAPEGIVTTLGPDIDSLKKGNVPVAVLPHLFHWFGKKRVLNPFGILAQLWVSLRLVFKMRPKVVISVGATNVVFYCYWAKLFGARIVHVECMNQVRSPSITGRMLYPICDALYVQWKELLNFYGRKARYEGWVL